jgi:hypothetical protein
MNGTQYRCIATNGVNPAATSAPATLTVNTGGTTPPPSGGGGGGGAPSLLWLCAAAALAALRGAQHRK